MYVQLYSCAGDNETLSVTISLPHAPLDQWKISPRPVENLPSTSGESPLNQRRTSPRPTEDPAQSIPDPAQSVLAGDSPSRQPVFWSSPQRTHNSPEPSPVLAFIRARWSKQSSLKHPLTPRGPIPLVRIRRGGSSEEAVAKPRVVMFRRRLTAMGAPRPYTHKRKHSNSPSFTGDFSTPSRMQMFLYIARVFEKRSPARRISECREGRIVEDNSTGPED